MVFGINLMFFEIIFDGVDYFYDIAKIFYI